jgi:SAM-dependent methyltransferase
MKAGSRNQPMTDIIVPLTPAWDPSFYRSGYEGFERLETFPSVRELEAYRSLLLEKTRLQVDFVRRKLGDHPFRVMEFGAGNGRFLIALALQGMLEEGVGLEIAHSRVAFAQRWVQDLSLPQVRPIQADVLEFTDYPNEHFDLALCITGAFNYFRPIDEGAPRTLLRRLHTALRPDGHLLLELYTMPARRARMLALNDGRLRLWNPLPPEDRFAYYLDDFQYWAESRILRHEKIFIGRDGTVDAGRVEVLAYYSPAEMKDELLTPAGFEDIRFFGDFQGAPACAEDSGILIVLARKGAMVAG